MKQALLTAHAFTKTNLVTISKEGRMFDEYKCSICNMIGRRYGFDEHATVADKYPDKLVYNCLGPKTDIWIGERIKVIQCTAGSGSFANMIPKSIHKIVAPPEGYNNGDRGVWVQGIGEPVKLLSNEFILIPKMKRTKFPKS